MTAKKKIKIREPKLDEYAMHELGEAAARQREVESAPLSDRQAARKDFLEALRDPALVAERIGWLIDGNYGYGQMIQAKRIIASPRMNRRAALTHLIGMYEWMCPVDLGVAAWKTLSSSEKKELDRAIDIVIEAAEKEMLEEQQQG